jgi:hypothetical protein
MAALCAYAAELMLSPAAVTADRLLPPGANGRLFGRVNRTDLFFNFRNRKPITGLPEQVARYPNSRSSPIRRCRR